MTNPAIRAALEVASHAFCNAMTGGECECMAEKCDHSCSIMDACAASVVAAFLFRAADVHAGCYERMEPRELLKHLATAVECAAQKDGNE